MEQFSKYQTFFVLLGILIFVAAIVSLIWYIPFSYQECLKVGHSKLYCVIHLGK